MKTVGIVSEYNPFHNGHQYLVETSKRELDAQAVVAVMSGNFTQRGEIAFFDMYSRAQVACENGFDLVLEIPPQFVLTSAEFYAYYSVYILHQLGIVDYLAFGSECGDIDELKHVKKKDVNSMKAQMKSGVTYAKAVGDSPLLQSANNILGAEYLNALQKLQSPIIPYTIKRKGVSHDEMTTCEQFASASYIRKQLRDGADVLNFLPRLPDANPVWEDALIPMLNYRLALDCRNDLSDIQNISEGLQNRILSSRGKETFRDMIDAIKCKRYPETRIRRALYSILLDLKKTNELPQYTRVLAFNETGQKLLKKMKKTAEIKIYSRITKTDIATNIQLQKELFCNEIYRLAQQHCNGGQNNG
ncbi:MAG: nucleotidyltransferase family protein [Clostridia bacterium]|nr:nucleotidyltransferase family protein [Clostridia bacterium]